eukprot:Seg802.5 transcript_id=Seg802.5/GoldUCD/mRNA.D3Y31 product="hypothetical protein" protein_id=Seg802.5/GoldUCD/D3Y31
MDRMTYNSFNSLRTTDNCQRGSLLNAYALEGSADLEHNVVNVDGRSTVACVTNLLSSAECKEIINSGNQYGFNNMMGKYTRSQRSNSRLLILDRKLATNLWQSLEPEITALLSENSLSCQPLGFDVSRGEWALHGLNEAFRVNKYSATSNEFFSVHKDAQFCPNADRRSLFTLLIYLNDDFSEGTTNFYFPKKSERDSILNGVGKDMTVQDEIESFGGLDKGYNKFEIKPSAGKAVIFSQNIIHESIPVTKGTKFILKTDVMVRRLDKSYGFAVSEAEKSDYLLCLNHFREAQNNELAGNKESAGNLYERALSIRYCYPMALKSDNFASKSADTCMKGLYLLPSVIWCHIFDFLSDRDIENIVQAFPDLYCVQRTWDERRYKMDEKYSKNIPAFIPSVQHQRGICTRLKFNDHLFFTENEEGCIRVSAMYAFYLLGHKWDDSFYTVRYNPETQEVFGVALKSLLADVFYNRPCFGSVYAVHQQDPLHRNTRNDFMASVDRTYMTLRHGAQFVGGSFEDKFSVNIKWLGVSEEAISKHLQEMSEIVDSDSFELYRDSLRNLVSEEAGGSSVQNDVHRLRDIDDLGHYYDSADTFSDSSDVDSIHNGDLYDFQKDELDRQILEAAKEKILTGNKSTNELIFFDSDSYDAIKLPCAPFFKILTEYRAQLSATMPYTRKHASSTSCGPNSALIELPIDKLEYIFESNQCFSPYEVYLNEMLDAVIPNYSYRRYRGSGVAAAIIADVEKHTRIERNSLCFCLLGQTGGFGSKYLHSANKPKCYNHLVFDFSSHEIVVSKIGDSEERNEVAGNDNVDAERAYVPSTCTRCCLFNDVIKRFSRWELVKMKNVFEYVVDIAPIVTETTPFNHASCQCVTPAFEVNECHNIQDYPHLDHIHIVGGMKIETNEVFVWTFYGGIVAL